MIPSPLRQAFAQAFQSLLKKTFALDSQMQSKLEHLNGQTVAIHLTGFDLSVYLTGDTHHIDVSLKQNQDVVAWLEGSPAAFISMSRPDLIQAHTIEQAVQIKGDARIARELESVIKQFDPDWEQAFCDHLGDVLGHQLFRLLRLSAGIGKSLFNKAAQDSRDFLVQESQDLVHPRELELFYQSVDTLHDDVERLAARIQLNR